MRLLKQRSNQISSYLSTSLIYILIGCEQVQLLPTVTACTKHTMVQTMKSIIVIIINEHRIDLCIRTSSFTYCSAHSATLVLDFIWSLLLSFITGMCCLGHCRVWWLYDQYLAAYRTFDVRQAEMSAIIASSTYSNP